MKVDPEGSFKELLSWPSAADILDEAILGLEGVGQHQEEQQGQVQQQLQHVKAADAVGRGMGSDSGCVTGDGGLLGRESSVTGSEGYGPGAAGARGSSSPGKDVKEMGGGLRR